jgi:hypothetical protein
LRHSEHVVNQHSGSRQKADIVRDRAAFCLNYCISRQRLLAWGEGLHGQRRSAVSQGSAIFAERCSPSSLVAAAAVRYDDGRYGIECTLKTRHAVLELLSADWCLGRELPKL